MNWPCRHPATAGSIDEGPRRASHDELAVARALAAEGHQVRTVAERYGTRSPDLMACGTSVEVKAFQSLGQRGGRPPSARSVANKLLDARGQGALAVIWAGDSGLTAATAQSGYRIFCDRAAEQGLGRLRAVRVMGKGFDMTLPAAVDVRRRSVKAGQSLPGEPNRARVDRPRAPASPITAPFLA